MGIMDFFRKGKSDEATEEPTAIDYVEWLFQYMLGTSRMTLVLDTSEPLPGNDSVPDGMAPPPCLPDPNVVINRLKILSGVNPVRLPTPTDGSFERPRKHLSIVVSTRFQDDVDRSTCAIRLVVKRLDGVVALSDN